MDGESGDGRRSDLACRNLEHTFDYVNHARERQEARKMDIKKYEYTNCLKIREQRKFTKKYENTDKIGVSRALTTTPEQCYNRRRERIPPRGI